MPKISEEKRAQVRQRLIDAAAAMLLEHGPTATTRQILEQADLSAGALYHYFSSLDELYAAVAERFLGLDDPLFEPPESARHRDQATTLSLIHLNVMSEFFAPGQHTIFGQLRVAAKSNEGIRKALTHYDELSVARSAGLNQASKDAGLFRQDLDGEALVEVITAFFEGFATKDGSTGFATSRTRVLRLFLEMLGERVAEPAHPLSKQLRHDLEEIADQ